MRPNIEREHLQRMIILKVYLDDGAAEVPITPETTCRDVLECCREPGEEQCQLLEVWRGCERLLADGERPWEVLRQKGAYAPEVTFHVKYPMMYDATGIGPPPPANGVKGLRLFLDKLPQGADLTLAELRGVAARQQKQIEAHQQLLVAKEQRLKFLKQQEARHHQGAPTTEVHQLRECVEAQELKLRRLRALRGQVEQHRTCNSNLSAELESIRALFNEKEKELSLAVAKVEDLTRQLEDLRRGGSTDIRHGPSPCLELEKLRRELLFRTRLNEQQNARLGQQRETLAKRQAAISHMDQRIAELQQRLHRKRILNQQLSNQLQSASQPKHAHLRPALVKGRPRAPALNIAAVEPLKRTVPESEVIQDDTKVSGDEDLAEFSVGKKDPKYQTLPYNTKFPGGHEDMKPPAPTVEKSSPPADRRSEKPDPSPVPPPTSPPPARGQQFSKPAPPHGLGHLVPRPYGSTYNSSLLGPLAAGHARGQHVPGTAPFTTAAGSPGGSPAPPWTKPVNQYPGHQTATPDGSNSEPPPGGPPPSVRQHPAPPSYPAGSLRASLRRVPPGGDIQSRPTVPPKLTTPLKPVPPPRQAHIQGTEDSRNRFPPPFYSRRVCGTPASHHVKTTPPYRDPEQVGIHEVEGVPPNNETESPQGRPSTTTRLQPGGHFSQRSAADDGHVTKRIEMPPTVMFPKDPADHRPENGHDEGPHQLEDERGPAVASSDRLKRRPYVESQSCPTDLDQVTSSPDNDILELRVPTGDRNAGSSIDSSSSQESNERVLSDGETSSDRPLHGHSAAFRRARKGNLKTTSTSRVQRRVSFDPLALLLDAALEGELELVKKTAREVANPSAANDEGITALHNAICAGHFEIVKFLVEFGCDVNAQDSDGWTPLHCAASCNNLPIVKFLVEHGACIFATTLSDLETAAEKCEEEEEGFDGCSEYLYSTQEKLGILNGGAVYAVHDYDSQNADELSFQDGDKLLVLRKGDETEREWWWSRLKDREGYIPRNLLGLHPRVTSRSDP